MNKIIALTLTLILVIPIATACSLAPTPVASTASPTRVPTKVAIAVPPTETTMPTLPLPTAVPSATRLLDTPTAVPSPAPTIPPGLYVTNVRVDPNPPPRGSDLTFYATFLNTTGVTQTYRWIVYIYRPDNLNRSFSETTRTETGVPVGSGEFKSQGSWKIPVAGSCENFIARVAFFDQENKTHVFTRPDGQVYQKEFAVCPPGEITPVLQPSPQPTPSPTFGPGLFAIDLRIEPSPPVRGVDLTFYTEFVNTTGNDQTFRWVVFIYEVDRPSNPFGQTSGATTTFPSAIGEAQSAGHWKLSLGGPCQDFFARAAWFDQNNKAVFFTTFDSKVFEKRFTVCPP